MVLCDLVGKCRLSKIHPGVLFIYFVMVLVLTMCVTSPVLLLASLLAASSVELYIGGGKRYLKQLRGMVLMTVVIAVGNVLLSHKGVNILFYVNDRAITAEAFWYGLFLGGMLSSAYLWFNLFQLFCDSEKLIYIFGKTLPTLGLLISMSLHYIPTLRQRLAVIRDAQRGMGRGEQRGLIEQIKQKGKEFSILISWSLENAIDNSDAMTARGYGLGRRSCFHTYRFLGRDGVFLMTICVAFVMGAIGTFGFAYRVYYYPAIVFPKVNGNLMIHYGCYVVFVCLPIIWEGIGDFYEHFRSK